MGGKEKYNMRPVVPTVVDKCGSQMENKCKIMQEMNLKYVVYGTQSRK